MDILTFCAAAVTLLITPGPTNTLLALAGAAQGVARSLPLIVAEIAGYLCVVTPLTLFAAPWLARHPTLALVLKIASACWVLFLAFRLWKPLAQAAGPALAPSFISVYTTTLLNPKAVVFGLVLIPYGPANEAVVWLVLLASLIVGVASLWLTAGATLFRRTSQRSPMLIRRVASAVLLGFSITLVWHTLAPALR